MTKASKETASLRKKSVTDLTKLLVQKQEALRDFRFGEAGGRTRNVREGRNLKHDIARIKTVLNEKARANTATLASNRKDA